MWDNSNLYSISNKNIKIVDVFSLFDEILCQISIDLNDIYPCRLKFESIQIGLIPSSFQIFLLSKVESQTIPFLIPTRILYLDFKHATSYIKDIGFALDQMLVPRSALKSSSGIDNFSILKSLDTSFGYMLFP